MTPLFPSREQKDKQTENITFPCIIYAVGNYDFLSLFKVLLSFLVNPPVPMPCPIRGRYRFKQTGPWSELIKGMFKTIILTGIIISVDHCYFANFENVMFCFPDTYSRYNGTTTSYDRL